MSFDINITYFILLGLFLLVAFLLNKVVFGPFLELFQERYDKMEGAVESAEALLKQAADQEATFRQQIKKATAVGIDARAKIRGEAQQKMSQRIAAEKARQQEVLGKRIAELDALRETAMKKATAEAQALATMTAEKLLGRSI